MRSRHAPRQSDVALYAPRNDSLSDYNSFLGYGWTMTPNMLAQAAGNPTVATFTRGDGSTATYEDDGLGNFTAMTPGVLNTLEKDDANSLWKETTPQGQSTAYPLDAAGNVTTFSPGNGWKVNGTINPLGEKTSTTFNAKQQPVERIDGLGYRSTTIYDDTTHDPIANGARLGRATCTGTPTLSGMCCSAPTGPTTAS